MTKRRSRAGAVASGRATPRRRDIAATPPAGDRVAAAARAARASARAWWTVAAAIAALAVVLYANSLGGALLFDDTNAIVNNAWVRSGDVTGILTHASWWGEGRGHGWRPLTTLSFAANFALHGFRPFGYHLVNVCLHAIVSLLVFAVFARVSGAPLVAAIAAFLFAAHPVHTEAVASVVGRAELISSAGFFTAWLLFLRADVQARRGRALLLEGLAVAVYLVALLAKENAFALVPVLVFADLLIAAPGARLARLRAHAGRYVALVGAAALYVLLRRAVLGGDSAAISLLDNPLVALPPLAYELTALKVSALYAWRLLVPWHLAADYSYRQVAAVESPLDAGLLAALALVVAIAILLWRCWRREPAVALGLGVLLLTFAMVSNVAFPIGTIMAERLLYLPSAGFCLAAGVLVEHLARSAPRAAAGDAPPDEHRWLERLASARVAVPLVAVLALYGLRTVTRNAVWHDRLTFFSTMVRDAPESARSHRELGAVLADLGDFAGAHAAFERSLAIRPEDAATLYNLGNALLQEQRVADAIASYQHALVLKPDFADAMVNLGNAESARGDHRAALEWMRRALAVTPASASLHMNVANELFRLGAHDEARAEYEAALALASDATAILTNYGAFLLASGDYEAAALVYRRAGDEPMALVGLAATFRAQGNTAEARATHARAARLYPTNGAIRQMGDVLARDAAAAGAGG